MKILHLFAVVMPENRVVEIPETSEWILNRLSTKIPPYEPCFKTLTDAQEYIEECNQWVLDFFGTLEGEERVIIPQDHEVDDDFVWPGDEKFIVFGNEMRKPGRPPKKDGAKKSPAKRK
jgi:hypothetical protein